jgi:hypothetical protein
MNAHDGIKPPTDTDERDGCASRAPVADAAGRHDSACTVRARRTFYRQGRGVRLIARRQDAHRPLNVPQLEFEPFGGVQEELAVGVD